MTDELLEEVQKSVKILRGEQSRAVKKHRSSSNLMEESGVSKTIPLHYDDQADMDKVYLFAVYADEDEKMEVWVLEKRFINSEF
ncbi:hypothetical protein Glove_325g16 [Diversispora epigaea]|uniref:Uncharacterized protein n=1 Tax=Diversispora epigaea TaxID=1348612 RepID=A0A397HMY8_9GLOM|nr:hypothetical protein Glove_325g16 [Diversispora epigaea]